MLYGNMEKSSVNLIIVFFLGMLKWLKEAVERKKIDHSFAIQLKASSNVSKIMLIESLCSPGSERV